MRLHQRDPSPGKGRLAQRICSAPTSREHGSRDTPIITARTSAFSSTVRREPSLSSLLILADTLGVSVEELIEELPMPKKRRMAIRIRALEGTQQPASAPES